MGSPALWSTPPQDLAKRSPDDGVQLVPADDLPERWARQVLDAETGLLSSGRHGRSVARPALAVAQILVLGRCDTRGPPKRTRAAIDGLTALRDVP